MQPIADDITVEKMTNPYFPLLRHFQALGTKTMVNDSMFSYLNPTSTFQQNLLRGPAVTHPY